MSSGLGPSSPPQKSRKACVSRARVRLQLWVLFPALLQLLDARSSSSCDGFATGLALQLEEVERIVQENDFEVERTLTVKAARSKFDADGEGALKKSYEGQLSPEFLSDLRRLGPQGRWFDVGAGSASAPREYLSSPDFPEKTRVTAFTVVEPSRSRLEAWEFEKFKHRNADRFEYRTGRPIEAYTADETGRCDLLSDLHGALSYSKDFDAVLTKYGELVEPGGLVYGALSAPRIVDEAGKPVQFETWLKSVRGFKVIWQLGDALKLQRTAEAVSVPPLELIDVIAGRPPLRRYRWRRRAPEP